MRTHRIIRCYIALARGERFSPSETGETIEFVGEYSGRTVGSYQLSQVDWYGIDENDDFNSFVIAKPSHIANLVYSSELRKIFGNLSFHYLFDRDGNFILPKGKGYLVPVKENGLFTGFEVISYLKRKAA